jgi:hypothetical protein
VLCFFEALLFLNGRSEVEFRLSWLFVMAIDFFALGWVSLWQGLKARNTTRAILSTSFFILVLPWLVFQAGIMLFDWRATGIRQLVRDLAISGWNLDRPMTPALYWMTICVGIAYLFGSRARRRVLKQFRVVATEQYQTRKVDE